jgi:hypothetical protein
MREPSFTTEPHPQSGREPPSGKSKAVKNSPGKKKKKAGKASPPKKSVVRAARANADVPVIVTGIDVMTGKKVTVIVQGREPPTGKAKN